jgi:hypothetical protein
MDERNVRFAYSSRNFAAAEKFAMGQMLTLLRLCSDAISDRMSGRTKNIVLVVASVLLGAIVYLYSHTTIHVTEPCRRNAAGEEVCPPPYKP